MQTKSYVVYGGMMAVMLLIMAPSSCRAAPLPSAPATVETDPVRGGGDSGDDICVWLHPGNLSKSLIIGTDSKNGIAVYDVSGNELVFYADGATGMIDARYNFPLQSKRIEVVAAGNLGKNQVVLYRVDPETRDLEEVTADAISPNIDIYGTCMYYSGKTGEYYVFVTSQKGEVEQWRLFGTEKGRIDAELARRFSLGPEGRNSEYTIEGCVADDHLGHLYLAQEDAGRIWRVSAEPKVNEPEPVLIDRPRSEGGHTVGDVEGLAIYYEEDRTGYLVANNQGNHTWTVYTREGENKYLMTFKISGSQNVDEVTSDDSLEITNVALNEAFPKGLVVVEDGRNTKPGNAGNNNYKLVPWENVSSLAAEPLDVDVTYDPRPVGRVKGK